MSKYKYLLDNGHGGLNPETGEYVTAPAKMFDHGDFVFQEGVFNRQIVARVAEKLKAAGIDFMILVPEWEDISLTERVRRVNEQHINGNLCSVVCIHANAGGGVGREFFTSEGQTISDKMADCYFDAFDDEIPKQKVRTGKWEDGDRDKEARFAMVQKVIPSSVLLEIGFMDNYDEAKWMMSDEGQEDIAEAIFQGILKIEETL